MGSESLRAAFADKEQINAFDCDSRELNRDFLVGFPIKTCLPLRFLLLC